LSAQAVENRAMRAKETRGGGGFQGLEVLKNSTERGEKTGRSKSGSKKQHREKSRCYGRLTSKQEKSKKGGAKRRKERNRGEQVGGSKKKQDTKKPPERKDA